MTRANRNLLLVFGVVGLLWIAYAIIMSYANSNGGSVASGSDFTQRQIEKDSSACYESRCVSPTCPSVRRRITSRQANATTAEVAACNHCSAQCDYEATVRWQGSQ
jgi:uncharacterized Fe-S center protein